MPTSPLGEFNITLGRETAHRYLTLWLEMCVDPKRPPADSVIVGHLLDCKELLVELERDSGMKEIIEGVHHRLREQRRTARSP